jgi:hypothetical protein
MSEVDPAQASNGAHALVARASEYMNSCRAHTQWYTDRTQSSAALMERHVKLRNGIDQERKDVELKQVVALLDVDIQIETLRKQKKAIKESFKEPKKLIRQRQTKVNRQIKVIEKAEALANGHVPMALSKRGVWKPARWLLSRSQLNKAKLERMAVHTFQTAEESSDDSNDTIYDEKTIAQQLTGKKARRAKARLRAYLDERR